MMDQVRISAGLRNRIRVRWRISVLVNTNRGAVTEPDSGPMAYMGARAGYIRPLQSHAIGACRVVAMRTGTTTSVRLLDDPMFA
jgi:hypothetical protein